MAIRHPSTSDPARPRHASRNDSRASGIDVRPATNRDVAAITHLEEEAFPNPWKYEFYQSEIAAAGRFNRVAIDTNGQLVGYVFAMHILDEMHINKIAVAKSLRRRGVATVLMQGCFAFAREHDIRVLSLEVRESNREAIAFYERLDFVRWSVRHAYYPDGENALIMALELS